MQFEPERSPAEVYIDGKFYTLKQLQRYIQFYNKHQITAGQTRCPLCGSYYDENELFVCAECGELQNADEKCTAHDHGGATVCRACCAQCAEQEAFADAVNRKIDFSRGK